MYSALSPGVIGVRTDSIESGIAAAKKHGFSGLEIDARHIADRVESDGADAVKELFESAGIVAAGWGLPTDWRSTDENWKRDLAELPRLAAATAAIGCYRSFTWVMPASNDRDLAENIAHHAARFRPIAEILGEHGHRLGLEFIGPKTIRDNFKFSFVFEMQPMLDLAAQIGPNVGLLLDCWHLYTSHGAMEDVEKLRETDVVYVHVNDAPAGIAIDAQQDGTRCLPGETGVIDIAAFLKGLAKIGYSGPVVAEPFKKELNDLPDDEARLALVGASMKKVFASAGV